MRLPQLRKVRTILARRKEMKKKSLQRLSLTMGMRRLAKKRRRGKSLR